MKILPINFGILTFFGFWRPISVNSPILKRIYNCYSVVTCLSVYSFTLSHLAGLVISADNLESLTASCFLLLSMMNVCCKTTNLLYKRKNIVELLQILNSEQCAAKDETEKRIHRKFQKQARFFTTCYLILTESTCSLITLRTFFSISKMILPFKSWIPYDVTNVNAYALTFFHQTIAHVTIANLQVAIDTMICGLMIQACSQIELLKYRLKKMFEDSKIGIEKDNSENLTYDGREKSNTSVKSLLVNCIEHHRRIVEYCEKLNSTFVVILFVQFAISLLVLCSSVYLLSKITEINDRFMSLLLYLSCMLYEIYLFCWYGNEVILQSLELGDAVYHINWTLLNVEDRRKLLMSMLFFRKPIRFTSTFLVSLSIESYCKILKTSYSVFNLLQRTST